jgi:hypothetical protein
MYDSKLSEALLNEGNPVGAGKVFRRLSEELLLFGFPPVVPDELPGIGQFFIISIVPG